MPTWAGGSFRRGHDYRRHRDDDERGTDAMTDDDAFLPRGLPFVSSDEISWERSISFGAPSSCDADARAFSSLPLPFLSADDDDGDEGDEPPRKLHRITHDANRLDDFVDLRRRANRIW